MMRFGLVIGMMLLLSFASTQTASAQSPGRRLQTSIYISPNSSLPLSLIHEILTQAAPQFNLTADQFIRIYHTCGCVEVVQIGPSTYRVTYGGIGIQIVIDATRRRLILPYSSL